MVKKTGKRLGKKRNGNMKGIVDDVINAAKKIIKPIIKPVLGGAGSGYVRGSQPLARYANNPVRPLRMGSNASGTASSLTGTDYLCDVTIPEAGCDVGTVLVNAVANPYKLGISRLAQMAPLYQRYFFNELTIEYQPVVNSTVDGQLMGYFEYDVKNDPADTSGIDNIKRAAAHYGQKPVQVWQGAEKKVSWTLKRVDNLTDLYCQKDEKDERWTDQGRFILMAATEFSNLLGSGSRTMGSLYVHYNISFFVPQISEQVLLGHSLTFRHDYSSADVPAQYLETLMAKPLSGGDIPYEFKTETGIMSLPPARYCLGLYSGCSGTQSVYGVGFGTSGSSTTVIAKSIVMSGTEAYGTFKHVRLEVESNTQVEVTPQVTAGAPAQGWFALYCFVLPSPATTLGAKETRRFEHRVRTRLRIEAFNRAMTRAQKAATARDEADRLSAASLAPDSDAERKEPYVLVRSASMSAASALSVPSLQDNTRGITSPVVLGRCQTQRVALTPPVAPTQWF